MHDELPTREKLLADIQPGIKLTKNLFLQIYGYNISTPGFADEAIAKLKDLGCSKAGEYYEQITSEWKEGNEKMLQEVAVWYKKQDSYKKEGEERRKQEQNSRKWMEGLY
ncbi:MAG: hypothetical protein K1W40_16670 [Schaedlerella sp.]|uniref:hypothetical protein n=1 Tax=Schaedlerella sp. TaxID=2676057 RepID=UPI003527FAFD